MDQKIEIKISIRNLVEFILRTGNIDNRYVGKNRAVDGTRAHQKVQQSKGDNYQAEVTLKYGVERENILLTLQGRADGIVQENGRTIIDEIKSTTLPLEHITEDYNPLHWAQAKCYGYIYCKENTLKEIDIQLTYYQLDTEAVKYLKQTFTFFELEDFFNKLVDDYLIWAEWTREWQTTRNDAINEMDFPFPDYRRGQRKLAVGVYQTIDEGKNLFVQAPTGIGKTISTLFPTIKAMGAGKNTKIFYLTAKTITRQVAEEALAILAKEGLAFKSITLTAKDKICFEKAGSCNPEGCSYAKGHFNRVNDAIMDVLKHENTMNREVIEVYAKKHHICPFEFSLDLAIWTDCIICDYNYAFDPRVYLKRFFDVHSGDYTFLVDEAHNLVDRSRTMFSAELYKRPFLELKRVFKDRHPKLSKALNKVNSFMIDMKKSCGEDKERIQNESPKAIFPLLQHVMREADEWLVQNEKTEGYEEMLQLYFDVLAFTKISELYDDHYVTYVEVYKRDVRVKLFCLDPSNLLREAIKRSKSAILFSATLAPIEYYRDILGGNEEDHKMLLSSPFDPDNLKVLLAHRVSTKYKDREDSYDALVTFIEKLIGEKTGNYMIFFPSYQYMTAISELFYEYHPNIQQMVQTPQMNEAEREAFIGSLQPNPEATLVVFAVLGGIFSEGIDLKGERLSGAVVVGVGLPQICLERDIIKNYFQEKNGHGFDYAYRYPGMNKVLQAAGRVIRTADDRGVVLLVDGRFNQRHYRRLFPTGWQDYKQVEEPAQLGRYLEGFWDEG